MFKFSSRSLERLAGVKKPLRDVAMRAIQLSTVDFGIVQGLRTLEEQKANVAKGASQTMRSKHLTGDAIDTILYIPGKGLTFEPEERFIEIAEAFATAAHELGVKIRWGRAWTIPDIGSYQGSMQEATNEYIAFRKSQGGKPFLDSGHFELN